MRTNPVRCLLLGCLTLGLVACGSPPAPTADVPAAPQARVSAPPPPTTTQPTPTQQTPPQRTPTRRSMPAPPPMDPNVVTAAVRQVEPNATLGAMVFDQASSTELLAVEADRQFSSASLVKLLIVVDQLASGAADPDDRQRLTRMLSVSDDDIASSYWVQGGRPDIVTRMADRIGLTGTEPPSDPGQWGDTSMTPRDILRVYQYILNELPAEDRDLIVTALASAPRSAADGFDQFFGLPDGLQVPVAIKQGWGNNSHAMVLHSTGLVGPANRYIMVLLTEHPNGSGWQRSADSVTAAAGALRPALPGLA